MSERTEEFRLPDFNGEKQTLAESGHIWFAGRLMVPAVILDDFSGLEKLWRRSVVVLKCNRPKGYEHGPWVAKNIRGAIGDVLKRKRQIDETANQRPDALTALYERHLIIGKHHVPSPMTIGVYPGKNDIEVVITLFGIAGLWRENLIYAANEALEYGIRVTEGGSVYPSWELTDWYWYRKECFSLVEASDTLSIELVSPMVTGSSGGVSGDFSVIPAAIANRVRLMARWLNVGVKLTPEQIDKNARNIRVEYDPTRPTVPFVRRRMQDRSKRVTIYANASGIRFHNVPSLLRPAFLLGQTTMAGGSVVHGFGDYRCY